MGTAEPVFHVLGFDFGHHPQILSLNPSFQRGARTLRLEVEVHWQPAAPREDLQRLQRALERFSPSLRAHQCRGPHAYRLFAETPGGQEPLEAPLALAHLLEHLFIDMVAFVSELPSVSGITGARRDATNRFDVFVECPLRSLARLVVGCGTAWMTALVAGAPLDGDPRALLELARLLYRHQPRELDAELAARLLRREPEAVRRDLRRLERERFASPVPYAMNFSGSPRYRLRWADGDSASEGPR